MEGGCALKLSWGSVWRDGLLQVFVRGLGTLEAVFFSKTFVVGEDLEGLFRLFMSHVLIYFLICPGRTNKN